MELTMMNSTITEKWKVYTIGGFFCIFVLALFVSSDFNDISLARTSVVINTSSLTTNSDQVVDQFVDSFPPTPTDERMISSTTQKNEYRSANPPTTVEPISTHSTVAIVTTTTAALPPVTMTSNLAPTSSSAPAPFPSSSNNTTSRRRNHVFEEENEDVQLSRKKSSSSSCNIYEGRWVYKPTENPMYYVEQCPFLEDQPSCRRNGRPDSDYEGWSWEPKDCHIPLFNGRDMLTRLRGKRVILVGDSLGRNQWLSLACLIYTSISPSQSFVKLSGSYKLLKVKDYNFTLEFYWSPLLVDVDQQRKVLKLDVLDPSSEQWKGADVMVFNTGHWWNHGPKSRSWQVIEFKGQLIEDMEKEQVYEHALSTWSTWLTQNVDQHKTTVFFRGISPEHKGKDWCFNATSPILDDSYASIYPQSMIDVTERMISTEVNRPTIESLKVVDRFPVRYLNITWLSGYRMDAHPALYSRKETESTKLLAEQVDIKAFAKRHADCSHWCLPGVPDTWNRLLYVSLFFFR